MSKNNSQILPAISPKTFGEKRDSHQLEVPDEYKTYPSPGKTRPDPVIDAASTEQMLAFQQ